MIISSSYIYDSDDHFIFLSYTHINIYLLALHDHKIIN